MDTIENLQDVFDVLNENQKLISGNYVQPVNFSGNRCSLDKISDEFVYDPNTDKMIQNLPPIEGIISYMRDSLKLNRKKEKIQEDVEISELELSENEIEEY